MRRGKRYASRALSIPGRVTRLANTSGSVSASENPEALETGKVLLNAGEDFVQGNLATIIKWSRF